MTITHALIVLLIAVTSARSGPVGTPERIWLHAKINGKTARLCFDSGSNSSLLTCLAARRLGLKSVSEPTNDIGNGFLAGETEEFTLNLEGAKWTTSFVLLNSPPFAGLECDGVVGWFTLSHNVIQVDACERELTFLGKVPRRAAQWTRFSVLTNFYTLDLNIPHGAHSNGVLCIDTGDPRGLCLPPREWSRWKEAHPQTPIAVDSHFSPTDGFYVYEEAWAEQISVGPIVLTGVPVAQSGRGNQGRFGAQYEGTLGLAALKRLDFTVDGNNSLAYLHPKKTRPPIYDHNRLGAVFVPTTMHTNQAVARVVEGGPAYHAGVRNGDILLQVDDVAVTSWNANWLSRFYLPAGTKLKLKLERDGKPFTSTATLRQILQPNPTKTSEQ